MTLHSTTASEQTIPELLATIAELRAKVSRLQHNPQLGMLNAGGLAERVRTLPEGR